MIKKWLQSLLSREIAREQAGFVKGRGTNSHTTSNYRESREFHNPLFICFVDFRKAFDTVQWRKLWEILSVMGVPDHLTYLIRKLCEDGTAAVRVDGIDSSLFKTEAGVRQGCILSLLFFNI